MIRAGSSVRRNIARSSGGNAPKLDLLFTSGVLDSRVTFTRASSATDSLYTDPAASTFNSFSTNIARMLTAGFLIEEARTQQLLNSAAPVTQTTASLGTGTYVFWCIGTGSVTSSAGTATASGLGAITGSLGTFQTIVVTVAGTLTFTVSGSINRFQLELGAFPTSFISTAGATATRAADVATVATSAFAYNQAAGTLVAEFNEPWSASVNPWPGISLCNAGSTDFMALYFGRNDSSSQIGQSIRAGNVNQSSGASALAVIPGTAKVALAYGAGSFSIAGNGVAFAGSAITLPAAATTLQLDMPQTRGVAGQASLNGYLRRIRYFNQRLPNAQLQALTQ